MQALADSETLAGVEILYLKGNPLGPRGAEAISRASCMKNLKKLYLAKTRLGVDGLDYLSQGDAL